MILFFLLMIMDINEVNHYPQELDLVESLCNRFTNGNLLRLCPLFIEMTGLRRFGRSRYSLLNSDPKHDAKAVDSSLGLAVCSVSFAYSSPLSLICASFTAALFLHLCSMLHAYSSLDGSIPASFSVASFGLCSMLFAQSSLLSFISASFDAASLDLCSVFHAHSSFNDLVCTSFTTASFAFNLCSVPNAHSSYFSLVGASISRAQCLRSPCLPVLPIVLSTFCSFSGQLLLFR
jgi:hypothetical protein